LEFSRELDSPCAVCSRAFRRGAVPKNDFGSDHDEDRDDEGKHRRENLRVNQEQTSRQRTHEQRDQYTPESHSFLCRLAPINKVTHYEYERRSSRGGEHAIDVERSNGGALNSHRNGPETKKNMCYVVGWLATVCEPKNQETCVTE
jgi:hypothetical protein